MSSENEGGTVDSPEEAGSETPVPDSPEIVAELVDEPAPLSPMEALELEVASVKDKLLRTAADFDNFRKRTKRDVLDASRRGAGDALREILPVIDNLERAVEAAKDAQDKDAIAEGVRMVLRQFQEVGERIELKRVPSVGERFDPNMHDAVQQLETNEHPIGSIVAEIQPGYQYRDRLLRPAMVVVARPAPKSEATDEVEAEQAGEA